MSAPDLAHVQPASCSGNVELLLHEIRHALRRLSLGGSGTSIDLGSLPFAPGEQEQLLEVLGEGEVSADVRVLGHSAVRETQLPGVWLVTHYNASNGVMATLIEVARIPEILLAQPQDMTRGINHLEVRLGVDGRHSDA